MALSIERRVVSVDNPVFLTTLSISYQNTCFGHDTYGVHAPIFSGGVRCMCACIRWGLGDLPVVTMPVPGLTRMTPALQLTDIGFAIEEMMEETLPG